MRIIIFLVLLLAFPLTVVGERGTFDAKVLALTEDGNNEFTLRLIQLSEPFGYVHNKDKEILIHLRFKCPAYECPDDGENPSMKTYLAAVEFLKSQITSSDRISFGVVDRGYAKIDGTSNEYQSNGLEVYEDVVYSDYDYFDF